MAAPAPVATPLPPLNPMKGDQQCPADRGHGSGSDPPLTEPPRPHDDDGKESLQDVQDQDDRRSLEAQRAQDVRRAGSAAADLPQVDAPADLAGDVPPGNGPEKE